MISLLIYNNYRHVCKGAVFFWCGPSVPGEVITCHLLLSFLNSIISFTGGFSV
ncbi:hypothetical protein DCCM_3738 [Desulfocucumis palustris]|uniref:Uncharacterized protein n=1 Tax=Desulfocucumis palustris TaxID=1898651 RepID=A0A2L2XE26_9FIRM|nr:hypothetical protein DCCM_3738 [Desulfocucumis palustris]